MAELGFSPHQLRKQAEQCAGSRTPELETIGFVCTEEAESAHREPAGITGHPWPHCSALQGRNTWTQAQWQPVPCARDSPAAPAVPASPSGATTKAGLGPSHEQQFALTWAGLSPPVPCSAPHSLSGCAVYTYALLMVILGHIHQHRVTEGSSVLTASQKKVKTSFNWLLPVICYIKNGITLHSFILGIHPSTATKIPHRAPGWYGLEPSRTSTTFSRS